jgi:hypothetical protein
MDRQEQALAGWLAAHPDYRLAEALVDAGVSAGRGRNRRRGALARFIEGGRTGDVPPGSCLVVESMSRFSREVATTTLRTLLNDVWGQGLAISFCTDGVVLDEDLIAREDHRLHAVLGAIGQARREWEERSRRSKGAVVRRSRLQDEGSTPPGRRPWWIDRAGDGWVLNPERAALVRRLVGLATEGLGRVRIAQVLAADGVLTARGEPWTPNAVLRVLKHPALVGTLRRQDRELAGFYPAVVSEAEHQALVVVMAGNAAKHASGSRTTLCRNLFQGIARCAWCGGPIGFVKPNRASRAGHPGFVWCRHAAERKQCPGGTATLLADAFEAHCLTRLQRAVWAELLMDPAATKRLEAVQTAAREAEQAARRTAERVERLQEKLGAVWEEGATPEVMEAAGRRVREAQEAHQEAERVRQAAAAALAGETGRKGGAEVAVELGEGIAGFLAGIGQASGAERLRFNRWLSSRQPSIRFLVDGPGQRVGMCVGVSGAPNWGLPAWMPLNARLSPLALAEGATGASYGEVSAGDLEGLRQAVGEAAGLGGDAVVEIELPDGSTVTLKP